MIEKKKHWLVVATGSNRKIYSISVYCNNGISRGEAIDRADSIINQTFIGVTIDNISAIGSDDFDLVTTIHT